MRLLLLASAIGLTAGLVDLGDLKEPMERLAFPTLQLGAPIVAFAAALGFALIALMRAGRGARALPGTARLFFTDPVLRRLCLILLTFGLASFALAETMEYEFAGSFYRHGAFAVIAALFAIGIVSSWHLAKTIMLGRSNLASAPIVSSALNTRGVLVDGRVGLVDLLENLMSLGHRRAILSASLAAAELQPGESLADIGCGTGELAMMAERLGEGRQAIGLDATPGMIAQARLRAAAIGSRARFEIGIAETLPMATGSLHAITSSFFFHHLPSPVKREALREMWRVLAPGGRLVIADYGWARSLAGKIAAFPMRFNFHEYVRTQLDGELERLIAEENLGRPEEIAVFLGYIRVLRLVKPDRN